MSKKTRIIKSFTWHVTGKLPAPDPAVGIYISRARSAIITARLIQLHSVFEHLHKAEIKKAKDEGVMTSNQLETIVHPNEYFKRSYLLKNLGKETDVKMEG